MEMRIKETSSKLCYFDLWRLHYHALDVLKSFSFMKDENENGRIRMAAVT